jgi:hypothetical protein
MSWVLKEQQKRRNEKNQKMIMLRNMQPRPFSKIQMVWTSQKTYQMKKKITILQFNPIFDMSIK